MPSESPSLDADDEARLAAYREADELAALRPLTGADSVDESYFRAKDEWETLRGRELAVEPLPAASGLTGRRVAVDGHDFWVHGVTHAGTDAERTFLRECVSAFRDRGASVYVEQGIRPMYFEDFGGVCSMDDYRWALLRSRERDVDSHVSGLADGRLAAIDDDDVDDVVARFRRATFSLVDAGRDVYGEAFARVLGDVASEFLTGREDLATGGDFESFRRRRVAAADPERLVDLQRYYERAFLPQPLEREWLAGHDPELELVTHARNERMAEYAVAHNDSATEVHLVVGAAHQPGVAYYLERLRDGERTVDGFVPV